MCAVHVCSACVYVNIQYIAWTYRLAYIPTTFALGGWSSMFLIGENPDEETDPSACPVHDALSALSKTAPSALSLRVFPPTTERGAEGEGTLLAEEGAGLGKEVGGVTSGGEGPDILILESWSSEMGEGQRVRCRVKTLSLHTVEPLIKDPLTKGHPPNKGHSSIPFLSSSEKRTTSELGTK